MVAWIGEDGSVEEASQPREERGPRKVQIHVDVPVDERPRQPPMSPFKEAERYAENGLGDHVKCVMEGWADGVRDSFDNRERGVQYRRWRYPW